jgi:hypothetical protein
MHLLQLENKGTAQPTLSGLQGKGPRMEARQEVRLKQAEAAKYKRLTETRSLNQPAAIIGFIRGGVHRETNEIHEENGPHQP